MFRQGFIQAWASDPQCLARQTSVTGNVLPDENIVMAEDVEEIVAMIESGEVCNYILILFFYYLNYYPVAQ